MSHYRLHGIYRLKPKRGKYSTQITPPVGFNLFVLQGMTGKQLPYIARVSMPMFFLMVGAVMLIYFVPGIVTWLPTQMKL